MARSRHVKARRAPEAIAAEKAARAERRAAREAARAAAKAYVRDSIKIGRRKAKDETKRRASYARTVADAERIAHGTSKPVATGQTIIKSRMYEAPLTKLKRLEELEVREEQAADEIVTAYHLTIGVNIVHNPDLGIRRELYGDEADESATKRIDLLDHYARWRRELVNTPALAAAVALLLDERHFRETERANQWRSGSSKKHLIAALRHFASIRGNTPRGARGWRMALPERGPLADAVQLARIVPRTRAGAASTA